ncbi:MAG: hypothetical protein Q4F27_05675, partial [Desulfovibrionaceae bacterium]|nr:hypothetical protein [Desulfovibrionaceae bacterium]
ETGVSFTMKAIGTTKEMAEEGMACLKAAMETFSRGSAQQLGAHRVVPLSESTTQRADSAVEARQAAIAKNIATYQSAILSNEKNTTSASSSSSSSGKVSKKSLTKYAVIGGGAGLLGMAVVWLLIYMLSGTIKESEILTRQFGLPLYGTLRHSRARKPGKGLDGLIEKWEFRNLPAANETVYDNICSLIPAGISGEILLTGTGRAEKMKPLYDALTARIQAPVSLKMEADLIHNSAAVIAAREASAVLVAEELYVSKEKEISREADILTLCGTPVLGAVAY